MRKQSVRWKSRSIYVFIVLCMLLTLVIPVSDIPVAKAADTPTNIALGKPAAASAAETGREASKANDGDPSTRWAASNNSPTNWWEVDLEGNYALTGTEVMWESTTKAYQYKIEVSTDHENWKVAVDQTANTEPGQVKTDSFTAASARYVRITVTGPSVVWASIFEFKVFGSEATSEPEPDPEPTLPENIALGKPAAASVAEAGRGASKGNDGDPSTRWASSNNLPNNWWEVDLEAYYELTGTEVIWESTTKAYEYKIEVSTDHENWRIVVDQTANTVPKQVMPDSFSAESVRYVRITVTGPKVVWASFFEFKVFGLNPSPEPIPVGSNVAENKTAAAISQETGHEASKGNDGDASTRWAAADNSASSWWEVDLGNYYYVSATEIDWELDNTAYQYRIEVSTDHRNWTVAVDKTANTEPAKTQTDIFIADLVKHVRITVTGGAWASFHEFKVFGLISTSEHPPEPVPVHDVTPGVIELPHPPQSYDLPENAAYVSNTAEFINAFTSSIATDIVLEDGTYSNPTPVVAGASHKIWSKTLGGAELDFGLRLKGNGSEIHGLKFNITSPEASGMAIIYIDNGNKNSKIFDSWFYGNHLTNAGIMSREISGLVVKRCIINGFKEYGIMWMAYYPNYRTAVPSIPPIIEDCDISSVYRDIPFSGNGTSEAGLWASTISSINRVRITDVSWMGVWTGANCNDAVFSNLTIDQTQAGIYVEHFTRRSTFQNLQIGPESGPSVLTYGVVTEWADPAVQNNPEPGQGTGGSHNNTFQYGMINSHTTGFNLEDAEYTTIRGITFKNQSSYAIKDLNSWGDEHSTTWQDQGNDFTGILDGAIPYSVAHWLPGVIGNAKFEFGSTEGWKLYNEAELVDSNQHSGSYAIKMMKAGSRVEQTIGVKPGRTYQIKGWVKSIQNGEKTYFGVKDFGGNEIKGYTTSTDYGQITLTFTVGKGTQYATIYFMRDDSGIGGGYGDDAEITELGLMSIESVSAANGTAKINLSSKPATPPAAEDFTATIAIDGGFEEQLPLSGIRYDGDRKVTGHFTPVARKSAEQHVMVAVKYKEEPFFTAPAFIVAALSPSDGGGSGDGSNGGGSGGDSNGGGSGDGSGQVSPALGAKLVDSEGNTRDIGAIRMLDKTTLLEIDGDILTEVLRKSSADQSGVKQVSIEIPEEKGITAYEVSMPAQLLASAKANEVVKLKTGLAEIDLPANMLSTGTFSGAKAVSVTIAMGDKSTLDAGVKAQIGDKPVIELGMKVDGKTVSWRNDEVPVTVMVPYKPSQKELEDPEHLTVWYIDGSQNIVPVTTGRYDADSGMIVFTTGHFSKYAVVYVQKTFNDLGKYNWAKKQIEVLASKGIISGNSQTAFAPSENITRADFMLLLVKTLGLHAEFDQNFDDVKQTDYYYEALGISRKLGIAAGIGENKFNPAETISRQDIMVLIERALQISNKLKADKNTSVLEKFNDKAEISGYAVKSVAALVNEGLIEGSDHAIHPLHKTSRAEAAVLLYRIYNRY